MKMLRAGQSRHQAVLPVPLHAAVDGPQEEEGRAQTNKFDINKYETQKHKTAHSTALKHDTKHNT